MKETAKQCTVIKKKLTEVFINGKNTMAVWNIDQFKGHGSGAAHRVEIPTGRAETAVAVERDKFQVSAVGTAIQGPAKGGIAAVDHLIDIFHFSFSWVESIYNFFIMVFDKRL